METCGLFISEPITFKEFQDSLDGIDKTVVEGYRLMGGRQPNWLLDPYFMI